MTLRQLQIFVRIVQEGSITVAADRLFLSKPAVSTALAELEKRCGHPLFDRHNNRLFLNDMGSRLLPLADELLQRSADIEHLFATNAIGTAALLRLGASFTIGHQLIPWLLRDYRQATGHQRQTVTIGNTRQICQQLASFELDMGLIEGEPELDCIDTKRWISDRMLIAAYPQHPLVGTGAVSLTDLDNQSWVVREVGSGSRDVFINRLVPLLVRWHTALELNATEAIINATAAGLGLSCISELEARHALRDGRLVEIPVNIDLQRPFYLAWHRDKYRSPTLMKFIAFGHEWRPQQDGRRLS
ncbi:MAG: LysR family transcriptional regulator [Halothiobacillus sp.]